MQRIVRYSSVLILATFCLLSLSGCGPKPVIVKGKLVLPANLPVQKDDRLTIGFIPEEKGLMASTAEYSADDQTFEAKGLDKKGLIPGKYAVAVSIVVPPGGNKTFERDEAFKAFNKKFDSGGSPLTIEITPDTTSITVDASAGTVTKN